MQEFSDGKKIEIRGEFSLTVYFFKHGQKSIITAATAGRRWV
jgi:hypothetical protein